MVAHIHDTHSTPDCQLAASPSMTRIRVYLSAWNRIHPQRSHPSGGAHRNHAGRRVASPIVVVLQGHTPTRSRWYPYRCH
jgi:hypothetical protein